MPRSVPPVLSHGSLSGLTQPVLTAQELSLRPWQVTDAADVAAAYDDPAIQHWHGMSLTLDEAEDWVRSWSRHWAAETGAGWAVTAGQELLGRIGLREVHLADGVAEVAYWVVPAARGRAVASRAVDALSRWCFDTLGLHRLELMHSVRNEASCRVAVKAGFELEGTKRRREQLSDGWHDMHLHALLVDDIPGLSQGRAAPHPA